jgi:hypothetical protein
MSYDERFCDNCKTKTIHLVLTDQGLRVFVCLQHKADVVMSKDESVSSPQLDKLRTHVPNFGADPFDLQWRGF